MTLTNNTKKKLIEVAIPLEAINAASAREKSIRHGHPSTLHLWWARRPLAACRAVLFAQLVDDPSSDLKAFPTHEAQEAERKRLFEIIEDLVQWENSTNEEVLERARAEIRKSCGGEFPPIYDPFSGGGSIPLEAQRLGLPAYGSDLNPVAVTIGKALIEIPPKFKDRLPVHPKQKDRQFYRDADGLAEDIKYYGEWMRERAWKRVGHLYPKVDLPKEDGGGKATVIAWLWARTVPSPDPAFSGVHVPIASSFLLSSKAGKEVWVQPIIDKAAKTIAYRIRKGGTKAELAKAAEGTKVGGGANFRCALSDTAVPAEYIRSKGRAGQIGQTLIAIVAEGKYGRVYVTPRLDDEAVAAAAKPTWRPDMNFFQQALGFRVGNYGMTTWADLFTQRQLTVLNTFSDLVHEVRGEIEKDARIAGLPDTPVSLRDNGSGAKAYAEAVSIYLALAASKATMFLNSLSRWRAGEGKTAPAFGRQAIAMVWDFAEVNPFAGAGGDFQGIVDGGRKPYCTCLQLPLEASFSKTRKHNPYQRTR